MPAMSQFKSRFRPKFKPTDKIFKVAKRLELGKATLMPGDFLIPESFKMDPRRLRLLYDQRYFEMFESEEAAKKYMADKIAADKKAAEDKKKADEAAKSAGI